MCIYTYIYIYIYIYICIDTLSCSITAHRSTLRIVYYSVLVHVWDVSDH